MTRITRELRTLIVVVAFIAVAILLLQPVPAAAQGRSAQWELEDVLKGPVPFAFGHRGFGANLGEHPDRPIENTTEAVRLAYRSGIRIAEVDVQVTVDGQAVVFHDDFLGDFPEDFTCINDLTYDELVALDPNIPKLGHVLNVARSFTRRGDTPKGVISLEIKTPAPLCDPFDETEIALVQAVVHEVRQARMNDQVILESFSPSLLLIAAQVAPDLPRALGMSILQFLTPQQVTDATGLPVTLIAKDVSLGLQWATIGPFFRLPGYQSVEQYVGVALTLGARAVDLDVLFLGQAEEIQPGSGAGLVSLLRGLGFSVWSFTVVDESGWDFLQSLGIDGIFIDDVPLGVTLQAPF